MCILFNLYHLRLYFSERALELTNHRGVEPAMEWLLAHADEPIPAAAPTATPDPTAAPNNPTTDEGVSTTPSEEPAQEAKSLKCEDCNKLFKNQGEVEFHAAKTGHSNFSESTEEKKPLTEEEKKAQLQLLEEKLKQKRLQREELERQEALEREKLRIKSGKDMLEARKKTEDQEMMKILEQRKREKLEEKVARDRVKAQIEADKAARKAKQLGITNTTQSNIAEPIQSPISSTVSAPTSSSKTPNKNYTNTKIQVRMYNGSVLTETFDAKEQLAAVRLFIQLKQGADFPFDLMTSFPKKKFIEEDYEKPLDALGLVPSAVLTATKPQFN